MADATNLDDIDVVQEVSLHNDHDAICDPVIQTVQHQSKSMFKGYFQDALASYVQNMLMDMDKEEVHMLLGVSLEITKMGDKLADLKNFLADANMRKITDPSVQAWVRELQDTMYDATDILDLCQLKALEKLGSRRDVGCLNPLVFCVRNPLHAHDIGNRIKRLNKRLEEIKERSMDFGFINLSSDEHGMCSYEHGNTRVASSTRSNRETSGVLDESSLVGEMIEVDTRNLVEMMIKEEKINQEYNKIMVFAIVGIGGIGKTTLAQMIFNNDIIQHEFTKKIWLSVSKDFSEVELLRRAITKAGGDHHAAGNSTTVLERNLKEAVQGHKTLLVMDDVWDHRAWKDVLRTPLFDALASGSRVLVTTRHDIVAQGMEAKKPYHHIDKLEPEDAWSLFKKQVVRDKNSEHQVDKLKDIAKEIIEKCDGLPLAVKVIGGMLSQKQIRPYDWEIVQIRRRDWEIVLHDDIRLVPEMPEELKYAMYISYEDLHPCLKQCFLHYSVLPKSTLFSLDEIVGMWISEGFVHVHGTSRGLEEIGKEYYDELMLRNLIEPNKGCSDQSICSMHDVVRSFAQYVARNEALVAQNNKIDISGKLNSQKLIRMSVLEESSELEWCSLQAHTSLRTLISVGHIKIKPKDSLLAFSNLRTLHVERANFDALVESLIPLIHLRYLSIRGTKTSRLPKNIGKMKLLQYVSLAGCKGLLELPNSISKLQQLRYLGLSGTSIQYIPRDFYGLTSLRNLYGFLAHMDRNWCSLC